MRTRLIILGAGGHARVLAEILAADPELELAGMTDPDPAAPGWPGVPCLDDAAVLEMDPRGLLLVNGLGSTGPTGARRRLFERFAGRGFRFAPVIHPAAVLSPSARAGQGTQVLAGAVVGTGARLGDNVLVNSGAIVEHDCRIGDHCHIASGAVVCGGCSIGAGTHVGAGAVINQSLTIGSGSIVASGAVVTGNVEDRALVAGVPARVKRKLEP